MLVVKTKSVNTSHYPPTLPALMCWTKHDGAVVVVTEIVSEDGVDVACCVVVDPGKSIFERFAVLDYGNMIPMSELRVFFGQIVLENK